MKVRALKNYYDGSYKRTVKAGEVVHYDRDRVKTLMAKGLIEEYIEEAKLEEKSEKAVKRTRKRKVED